MNASPLSLVLGATPWARRIFDERLCRLPGRWRYVATPGELEALDLEGDPPRRIFALHWSWKVPESVFGRYECIGFHMTDLPFGRGGSPLQNLILRGIAVTRLTALRMTGEFDAGPVYLKRDLSLAGSAREIYDRAMDLAADMIVDILDTEPVPVPQTGTPTVFPRRTPAESEIPLGLDPAGLYDFIRMLDAPGYPRAFIERGGLRYEFSQAALSGGGLTARVSIHPRHGATS